MVLNLLKCPLMDRLYCRVHLRLWRLRSRLLVCLGRRSTYSRVGQVGFGGCKLDLATPVAVIEIFKEGEVRGDERPSYTRGWRSLNPDVHGGNEFTDS